MTRQEARGYLKPMAWHGKAAPYTSEGRRVFSVHSNSGFALARVGRLAHSVASAGAVWIDGKPYMAAMFRCGLRTFDPVFPRDIEDIEVFCEHCLSREQGPCVYRYFNGNWDLLYIGSTQARLMRRAGHKRDSWWWPEVEHVRFDEHPSMDEARSAEWRAIWVENPRYNVRGKSPADAKATR